MQAYRARIYRASLSAVAWAKAEKPKDSPLWQCIFEHFDAFLDVYEERYRPRYGFLRPVIPEVVYKFLD